MVITKCDREYAAYFDKHLENKIFPIYYSKQGWLIYDCTRTSVGDMDRRDRECNIKRLEEKNCQVISKSCQ